MTLDLSDGLCFPRQKIKLITTEVDDELEGLSRKAMDRVLRSAVEHAATRVSPPIQATRGLVAFATGRFGATNSELRMSLKGRWTKPLAR